MFVVLGGPTKPELPLPPQGQAPERHRPLPCRPYRAHVVFSHRATNMALLRSYRCHWSCTRAFMSRRAGEGESKGAPFASIA